MTARDLIEAVENKVLATYATHASASRGRTLHGDESDDYRTAFQRDRDRILYSKAFRDLQYKTQVFLINEGDFYRTRLTHTLEVAQHARTLARVLRLNEDLCEAIAYAHDLGHPPFGHAGEEALNEIMRDDGGFEHNSQSLRIVDFLEKRYANHDGLNLTFETREGIARHHTSYDHPLASAEFSSTPSPSLEAQIVNIADPLAYCAHDLEDALCAGFITFADIEALDNAFLRDILERCQDRHAEFAASGTLLKSRLLVRELIEQTNILVIRQTQENIAKRSIKTPQDVRAANGAIALLPAKQWEDIVKLKDFLMQRVYRTPQVCVMNEKGRLIIDSLFSHLTKKPQMLPLLWQERHNTQMQDGARRRVIADYIASMTDQYAALLYQMMFIPSERIMFSFQD